MKLLFESWKKFLAEAEESKTLYVFDFDDTLATSKSKVKVTSKSGEEKMLLPAEYALYDKEPGDVMDYAEFADLKEPSVIKRTTDVFFKHIKDDNNLYAILTARDQGIEPALRAHLRGQAKMYGVDPEIIDQKLEVRGLGDSNPLAKSGWIADKIKENPEVKRAIFFDDSHKNLKAVASLQDEFPDVRIQAIDPQKAKKMSKEKFIRRHDIPLEEQD